jgi:hypothetical protein
MKLATIVGTIIILFAVGVLAMNSTFLGFDAKEKGFADPIYVIAIILSVFLIAYVGKDLMKK